MYATTEAYQSAMAEIARPKAHARVTLGLVDPTVLHDAAIATSEADSYSNLADILEDPEPRRYAAFDSDFYALDGSLYTPPDDARLATAQGYVSASVAGSDGVFATAPLLTIACTADHDISGLTLVWARAEEMPTQMTVTAFSSSGGQLASTVATPTELRTYAQLLATGARKLTISFDKAAAGRRARLPEIVLGAGYQYADSEIMSIAERRTGSPIAAELPYREANITLYDREGKWDLMGTTALVRFLRSGQAVQIYYGQELDDGTTEWIPSLGWHLVSFSAEDDKVTLTCEGVLSLHNAAGDVYESTRDFVFGGTIPTVYDAAKAVLDDAGITDYYINGKLKSQSLYNPIPMVSHSAALQLIAGAAGALLGETVEGQIRLDVEAAQSDLTAAGDLPAWDKPASLINGTAKDYAAFDVDFFRLDGGVDALADDAASPYLPLYNGGYISTDVSTAPTPAGSFGPFAAEIDLATPAYVGSMTIDWGAQSFPTQAQLWINVKHTDGTIARAVKAFTPTAKTTTVGVNTPDCSYISIYQAVDKAGQRARIKSVSISPDVPFVITDDSIIDRPKGSLSDQVKQLVLKSVQYTPDWVRPAEGGTGHELETEIFNDSVPVGTTRIVHDTPIGAVRVYSVDAGYTATVVDKAWVTYLTVTATTGTGSSAKVVLYGVKTTKSDVSLTVPLADTGSSVEIQNDLLTCIAADDSAAISRAKAYFTRATKYELSVRGWPEMEPMDLLQIREAGNTCYLLSYQQDFDGAYSGKMTLRKAAI